MIFKPEMVELILSGRKAVTRRPVKHNDNFSSPNFGNPIPCRYKVGKDYAIQPGRGKKAVGRLRVVGVSREPLNGRFPNLPFVRSKAVEARLEGFKSWLKFQEYWVALYGGYDPARLVDRIEFKLAPPSPGTEVEGG